MVGFNERSRGVPFSHVRPGVLCRSYLEAKATMATAPELWQEDAEDHSKAHHKAKGEETELAPPPGTSV